MATISYHYANASLGGMVKRGFDMQKILMSAGINPKLTAQPAARVSDSQMTRLIQIVWQTLDDEFMGFTQTACKYGAFTLMAKSVRRCETLREALEIGTELYNRFTDEIHTELTVTEKTAQISASFTAPELDPNHFFQEFWLVIWHRFASWLINRKIPLFHANLTYPEPAHTIELNYLFPCLLRFECSKNQLIFDNQYLNLQPVRSETELEKFLENSPAELMTIPGDDRSLKQKIAKLIAKQHTKELIFPTLSQIANHLHVTQQTLHRRLTQEGTSFQKIKDNVRRDIAVTRLIKDRMPVNQVAELVGYSESRSFSRAFKHWTGLSPREFCKFV